MNIELRNFKSHDGLSEETQCFEALIIIDGRAAGRVTNRGTGGAHEYSDNATYDLLTRHAATLPPMSLDMGGTIRMVPYSADSVIDDLVTDAFLVRDYRRTAKKNLMFMQDGKLFAVRCKDAADLASLLATPDVAAKFKADRVLNAMPEVDAIALYKAAAMRMQK